MVTTLSFSLYIKNPKLTRLNIFDLLLSIVVFNAFANSPSVKVFVFLDRAKDAIAEIGLTLLSPLILSYKRSSK